MIVHANKDNTLAFTTAKKLLGQFKQLSPVLTKNSIASKAMAANNNTIEHFIDVNITFLYKHIIHKCYINQNHCIKTNDILFTYFTV